MTHFRKIKKCPFLTFHHIFLQNYFRGLKCFNGMGLYHEVEARLRVPLKIFYVFWKTTLPHIKIFKNYSRAYPYQINLQPSDILMWKKLFWEVIFFCCNYVDWNFLWNLYYCFIYFSRLKLQSKTFRSVNHGNGKVWYSKSFQWFL